jgi:hypothetical protein
LLTNLELAPSISRVSRNTPEKAMNPGGSLMTHGDVYADFYSNQIRQGADRGLIIAPGPDGAASAGEEGGIDFNDGSAFEKEIFGDGGAGYSDGPSARDAHEWGIDTGFFPRNERPRLDTDSVMIAATGVAQALQAGDLDAASQLALQVDPRSIREAKFELFGVLADASPEERQNLLRLAADLKMLQRASFAFELIANGDEREGMFLLRQLLPEAGPRPGTDAGPRPGTDAGPQPGQDSVPSSRTDGGTNIPLPGSTGDGGVEQVPAPTGTTDGQESPYIIVPTDPGTPPETPPDLQPGTPPDLQPGTPPETQPPPQGLSPVVQDMILPTQ